MPAGFTHLCHRMFLLLQKIFKGQLTRILLFHFFVHIDRTFRSDSKSLNFINIGAAVKPREANEVRE